jgi:hypothetical protein
VKKTELDAHHDSQQASARAPPAPPLSAQRSACNRTICCDEVGVLGGGRESLYDHVARRVALS